VAICNSFSGDMPLAAQHLWWCWWWWSGNGRGEK